MKLDFWEMLPAYLFIFVMVLFTGTIFYLIMHEFGNSAKLSELERDGLVTPEACKLYSSTIDRESLCLKRLEMKLLLENKHVSKVEV